MVPFEKFRELAISKSITILPFKVCFGKYESQLDNYNETYNFEHFIFNNEFIKINSINLNAQVKNNIIKILLLKKDKASLELLNDQILELINSTVPMIYKLNYIKTYRTIVDAYETSNQLKDLTKLSVVNNYDPIYINEYNNKNLDNFEKLRWFYTYINKTMEQNPDILLNDPLDKNANLIWALYWICTKSSEITVIDKQIFYNELVKTWDLIIKHSTSNCLMYYLWFNKMNKRTLYKPMIKASIWDKIGDFIEDSLLTYQFR